MAQQVRELMTQNLQTCPAGTTLDAAAKTMRDADIGDVLVLADDGTVCGVVTDRDITVRAVAEGHDASTVRLDEICSHDLVSVGPDTAAEDAAKIMRDRAVRRLPVIEEGKAVGIVSIGDLAIERDSESALADISAARGNV